MNNSLKGQYRQNMKIVVNLLKVFGRTDPEAAWWAFNDFIVLEEVTSDRTCNQFRCIPYSDGLAIDDFCRRLDSANSHLQQP